MTQQEKQLLLKDLCARLPYKVKIKIRSNDIRTVRAVDMVDGIVHFVESDSISPFGVHIEHPVTFRQAVKPYLRPLSSMTEKERKEYKETCFSGIIHTLVTFEWFHAHHFDYRGLIEKGLAIEAPEDMYEGKNEMLDKPQVPEVNLDEELESFIKSEIPYGTGGYGDMMRIAKHFYYLGKNSK